MTCNGSVATLTSGTYAVTRDCAHALAKCDPASPTGRTDRHPTGCVHPAKDRCDGDVRIGCDGTGRLSFHDCTRVPGGKCQQVGSALECVYPDNNSFFPPTCNGNVLTTCVFGTPVDIDCTALGLSRCATGYCAR